MNAPRMLEGYRVLDFTQFVAGPTCSRLLAEMGAEVVKLELAPEGDRVRTMGLKPRLPDKVRSSHSTYYMQHDHSKLSFAIDLKKPGARELVMSMVPKFDVVVENFAPGVIKRLGFAYQDVKRIKPNIIMCSISMAGQTGPLSDKAGFDLIGQAYAGITDGIGEPDRAPSVITMAIGDVSTGVAAAMAVCAALLHRERTGEGQYLDGSLLDTYFHMHDMNVPKIALAGDRIRPTRAGSQAVGPGPAGVFRYRGDEYVMILITPHQWPQVVRAMSMPELARDPRFSGARARQDNRKELQRIIEDWLASFPTRAEAIAALDQERVPCAPVLTVNEAITHPHLNERKTIRWVDDPLLGRVATPAVPVKFSAWPDRMELRSARLGEDNERVLRDYLNLDDDQIRDLYKDGVLVRDSTIGPNPVGA
ncbi:MAG TPA: CoA transferase [Candidatus Binataceae bacterium]|nr:CoA transferase [Candidatus Binataceae bacterium]